MFRRLCIWAVVLALACSGGTASARTKAKPHAVKKHAAKKHRPRKARPPAPRTARVPNMPVGWEWPPSNEMYGAGHVCLSDLSELGVRWQPGPATRAIATPVIVPEMDFAGLRVVRTRSKGPIVMDCALARALARDAAPLLRQLRVTELHIGQIHGFRDVQGRPGVLSRHSLGLAMDVYGFVTSDGVEHLVEHGYLAGDPTLHLAELLLGRTGAFRTLLTPGNDPGPHYNHFHIEARAFGDKVVERLVRGSATGWKDLLVLVQLVPGLPVRVAL